MKQHAGYWPVSGRTGHQSRGSSYVARWMKTHNPKYDSVTLQQFISIPCNSMDITVWTSEGYESSKLWWANYKEGRMIGSKFNDGLE